MSQRVNGSKTLDSERYATVSETMHLEDCLRELSSQLSKNSTIQEGIIKKIESMDASIKKLESEETKRRTAWSLIKNLWKKAPGICMGIFITIFFMTDGTIHFSDIVTHYYKTKGK